MCSHIRALDLHFSTKIQPHYKCNKASHQANHTKTHLLILLSICSMGNWGTCDDSRSSHGFCILSRQNYFFYYEVSGRPRRVQRAHCQAPVLHCFQADSSPASWALWRIQNHAAMMNFLYCRLLLWKHHPPVEIAVRPSGIGLSRRGI